MKKVSPTYSTSDYTEFFSSEQSNEVILKDLVNFEEYSNFDVGAIEEVKVREKIIGDVNFASPAASFEGTLDEWQENLRFNEFSDIPP